MAVKLGNKVRDIYTGFEGIAVARSEFLYGCSRICIEGAGLNKDGVPGDGYWFDEQRVETVKKQKAKISPESDAGPGGPQQDSLVSSRMSGPGRL